MKRILLATVTIMVLAPAAKAADFDPPPPPLPPATTWSGYHIGGSFGGLLDLPSLPDGCNNPDAYGAVADPVEPLTEAGAAAVADYSAAEIDIVCQSQTSGDSSAFAAGIRGGYDLQMGSWVFGVLADYNFTNAQQSASFSFDRDSGFFANTPGIDGLWSNPNDPASGTALQTLMHQTQLDGFGTARARIGTTFGHDERMLLFVSGGLAYGDVSTRRSETAQYTAEEANRVFDSGGDGVYDPTTLEDATSLPVNCQDVDGGGVTCSSSGSSSEFQFGYSVGAGMEYMMSDMIALGGEFMYVNLGDVEGPAGDLDFWSAMATVSLRFK